MTTLLEPEISEPTTRREPADDVPVVLRHRQATEAAADRVLVDCFVCGRTHPPGSDDDPGC